MIERKEMPEWYEKKCREYVQKTYPSLYKNTHPDCDEMSSFCFSILWPQIEVMREALEFYANDIIDTDIAQVALKKVEAMT